MLQLGFIFLPQHIEATFNGLAKRQRGAVIGLHHFLDLGLRFGEAFGLRAALGSHALEQARRQGSDGFVDLFAKRTAVFAGCRAILSQTGSKGVETLSLGSGHDIDQTLQILRDPGHAIGHFFACLNILTLGFLAD